MPFSLKLYKFINTDTSSNHLSQMDSEHQHNNDEKFFHPSHQDQDDFFSYVPNNFRGYNLNLSWYNDHFIMRTSNTREFLKNLLFLQTYSHVNSQFYFASRLYQNQPIMPTDIYSSKLLVYFCMRFLHHAHILFNKQKKGE